MANRSQNGWWARRETNRTERAHQQWPRLPLRSHNVDRSKNEWRAKTTLICLVLCACIAAGCRTVQADLVDGDVQPSPTATTEAFFGFGSPDRGARSEESVVRPTAVPTARPTAPPTPTATATPIETETDEVVIAPPDVMLDEGIAERTDSSDSSGSDDPLDTADSPPANRLDDAPAEPAKALVIFDIVDDQLVDKSGATPVDADVRATADRIWGRFIELIPADQRVDVVEFGVWDELTGGGYVTRTGDKTVWELHVASSLQGIFLDYLLLHEFGHIYSLRAGESIAIGPSATKEGCASWFVGDGCLLEDSLLDRYYERFWSATMLERSQRITTETDTSLFMVDYPGSFVSRYATTNPVEDFAETWVSFVTRPRPLPDGTLATEKLQFLWRRTALVELREQLRPSLTAPPAPTD